MANFIAELTSKFLFDEASGQLIDTIGSYSSVSVIGTPQYDEPGITYDGSTDGHVFDTDTDRFIIPNGPHVVYMKMKTTDAMVGVNRYLFSTTIRNATQQGPFMRWTGASQEFLFAGHLASGSASFLPIDIGRDLNVGETIVIMMSRNNVGALLEAVVLSDGGLDLSGTTTGQGGTMAAGVDAYQIMRDGAGVTFTPGQMLEMGMIKNNFKSISDMQETADFILNPNTAPTGTINSIVQRT